MIAFNVTADKCMVLGFAGRLSIFRSVVRCISVNRHALTVALEQRESGQGIGADNCMESRQMIECPRCDFENAHKAQTCQRCGVALFGVDAICGMPMFGGGSVGQVLDGRYVIVRRIGPDGMGVLYQAEDAEQDIPVLLRALPITLGDAPRHIDRLGRRAQTVLHLSHPNIIPLLGYRLDSDVRYLVTEYVEGPTLQEELSDAGPLTIDQMLNIFTPLAEALDYAHSRSHIHGDICPANIILPPDAPAKLANFQITRQLKESLAQTASEQPPDASLYSAPEQFTTANPNPQSDIYSLAATIYQSLCRPPLFWRGWMEYQVLKEDPCPLDGLTNRQNAALLKALSRDCASRYRSAGKLLADLGTVAAAPEEEAEDYTKAIAQAQEELKAQVQARLKAEQTLEAETRARLEAEQKADAETRARIEAEEKLKTFAKAVDRIENDARDKQKHYADRIARAQEKLDAQTKVRLAAEEALKAETEKLIALEAKSARAIAAAEARAREFYAASIAETQEKIDAETKARIQAEDKARAEAEKVARLEDKLKQKADAAAKKQAKAEAKQHAKAAAIARAEAEEKLKAQTRARAEAEDRLRAYKREAAYAPESLAAEPDGRASLLAQTTPAAKNQPRKPISNVKVLVAIVIVATLVTAAIVSRGRNGKREVAHPEATELWIQAQLSAAQQDYAGAILAANAVVVKFPQYAGEQGVEHIRTKWQQALTAQGLWAQTRRLVEQSRYEQAIAGAAKLIDDYPDSYYTHEVKAQLPLWKDIVRTDERISALMAKAIEARDANDPDTALGAAMSVLELDPNNVEALAFKAEMKTEK